MEPIERERLKCSRCGFDVQDDIIRSTKEKYNIDIPEEKFQLFYDQDGKQNLDWLCDTCLLNTQDESTENFLPMQATKDSIKFTDESGKVIDKVHHPGPGGHAKQYEAHTIWHIPDDATRAKCVLLSEKFSKQHPRWKQEKIARKVAEYFKLKKIDTKNANTN